MSESVPDALVGSAIERVVPGSAAVSEHLVREHVKRYEFAAPRVAGMRVLDVACGSGYGTQILAAQATSIIGVDIEPKAVAYARMHYTASNLQFEVADAHSLAGFDDNSFDAVVSFETIEHLPNYAMYLASVRRVLRTGGLYIVSTPDTEFTRKAKLPPPLPNPYHIHEFELEELRAALTTHFESVAIFGQQFYIEPSMLRKRVQSIALRVIASPAYQRTRALIPKAILTSGVRLSGIDNDNDITELERSTGIPEILIAVCS